MLASLEIIAPGTFGVEIPWQDHLNTARRMIISRAESRGIDNQRDKVSHFLIRWFAYLDVLGNFSSVGPSKHNIVFSGDLYDFGKENEFSIDCLLGFSGFLAGILAKIADLARHCDQGRLTDKGEINQAWKPPPQIVKVAEKVKEDLARANTQNYTHCPHRHSSTQQEIAWDSVEMAALNQAFHWAGTIHLNRRVLGLPQDSEEVQKAVCEIVGSMYKVRKGGSAEACLIFPMFTAGCEAREESQRDVIFARIGSVEESGMTQVRPFFPSLLLSLIVSEVQEARRILERVWATGKPWEMFVHGEFFG
ncbi:MAG: hypothetical protein LQ340_000732 [Diploschistes diacapsis]|nr:MAG: hypothetical protein LQ340_000732 [Diploschistes diacapsis]